MARSTWISVGALALFFATPCRAAVLFNDSTFNLANYTQQLYSSDPTITVGAAQNLASGNPAPSLEIRIGTPAVNFETQQGFINNGFTFDPTTQGTISSIDFSLDKKFTSNLDFDFNSVRALIEQGGNFYEASISISTTQGVWTMGTGSLVASDFALFNFVTGALDPSQNPSFSGAALAFGFVNRFAQVAPAGFDPIAASDDVFYDNLALALNVADSSVPEPASLTLLGSGLAIALARRRRLSTARSETSGSSPARGARS